MGDLYPHSLTQDSSTESFSSISIECGDCHGMLVCCIVYKKLFVKRFSWLLKPLKEERFFNKLALTSNEANLSGYTQVIVKNVLASDETFLLNSFTGSSVNKGLLLQNISKHSIFPKPARVSTLGTLFSASFVVNYIPGSTYWVQIVIIIYFAWFLL